MRNNLPVNWTFAFAVLILIALTGSILYFSQSITQNRQTTSTKAAGNSCTDGIVQSSIQFTRPDGSVISNDSVVDNLTGIRCKLRVTGVAQADKYNVCGIKINDNWPVACPNQQIQTDWIHEEIYTWDTDVSTTFLRCDQSLTNVPSGAKLQAVVARFIPGSTNCNWTDTAQFVQGPSIFYQSSPSPTDQFTPTPSTFPPTISPTPSPSTQEQTSLYISPQSVQTGGQVTITATGTTSCSTFISNPPVSSGFTSCTQNGGFSCSDNPINDGKPCWWRWNCNTSQTPGNYTATFTASNNSSCTSTASFNITSIACPRGDRGNINCDSSGCINNEDLSIFINYFGKNIPTSLPSNVSTPNLFTLDQSNIINTGDYEILRQNYGNCSLN